MDEPTRAGQSDNRSELLFQLQRCCVSHSRLCSEAGFTAGPKQHLKTHREDGPFVCSLCNETFSQKQSCRDHIRNKHFQPKGVTSKLVYVDNHIQVCGPLSVEEQPAQLMDDLFIQPTTRGVQRAATIVSIKRIQVNRNVGSISSPSTSSLGQEAIQSVETSKLAPPTSVSTSSISSTNSINNSGKRNLSTSDETRRPSKMHRSLPEPPLKANKSLDNPTSQPRPSLQLKPANLDCPHCSKRFDARTALNLHILANHKCSPVQTRQFVCAFVGCCVSMSGCRLSDVLWHVAIVHHHTTGNPCEFFDIRDK